MMSAIVVVPIASAHNCRGQRKKNSGFSLGKSGSGRKSIGISTFLRNGWAQASYIISQ
jgi:hypothetical protein